MGLSAATYSAEEVIELMHLSGSMSDLRDFWCIVRTEWKLYSAADFEDILTTYETRIDYHMSQEFITCGVCNCRNIPGDTNCIFCNSPIKEL